ncbi:hypothetical protein Tco_0918098, partial [Tanacetum coccineum]
MFPISWKRFGGVSEAYPYPRRFQTGTAAQQAFSCFRGENCTAFRKKIDSGICGMDDDYVSALACLHDTIPSFDFSVFTNKDTAPSKAQQTLASALFSEMVKDMKVHFDMTMRQKAVFECLRAPHAQDFLLAIPIDGLDQHMSPVEYRTILKYHLMIPLFPVDAICHLRLAIPCQLVPRQTFSKIRRGGNLQSQKGKKAPNEKAIRGSTANAVLAMLSWIFSKAVLALDTVLSPHQYRLQKY